MVKKTKRIFCLILATLCILNLVPVMGASRLIHKPVPDTIKVYGAIKTSTTYFDIDANVKNIKQTDKAYLDSYLYVESNNQVILKKKFESLSMRVTIPKQKRGTQLKIYFRNGKDQTKTIYKTVVGGRDISVLPESPILKMPSVSYNYDTRILWMEATPGAQVTVKAFNRPLRTATIPANGILRLKIPATKLGETIWVFTSNGTVRSRFAQFENFKYYYSPAM